jgi:ATP-dependent RNA helicase RhlE
MPFSTLGLRPELVKAVADQGYTEPSPIQAKAIPPIIDGQDVMAAAQTGTGKTAGFSLPMLHNLTKPGAKAVKPNHIRALVLTPTRELAAQVADSVAFNRKYLNLSSLVVFGGVKINPQMMKLRKGVDVLVATPGRLMDLHQQNAVSFDQVEILVLDEADRMLDMGFIRDIRKILKLLPAQRQNLLFSATFSNEIKSLAHGILHKPVEVSVTPPNSTVEAITQWIHPVDKSKKVKLLIHLIKENDWWQVLVFSRTKHGANKMVKLLDRAGISALAIHGDKSQGSRTKALAAFKAKKIQALVATDIAARGIDIDQLPHVVNVDLPHVSEDYVHRIGRTGRAGASGEAISLVCVEEIKELQGIERLTKKLLERRIVEGFEPENPLPATSLKGGRVSSDRAVAPKRKKPSSGRGSGIDGSSKQGRQQILNKITDSKGAKSSPKRKPGGKNAKGIQSSQSSADAKPENKPARKPRRSGKPQNQSKASQSQNKTNADIWKKQ